jgi:predicted nuclease of predicted toxin-antitoxin system
MRILANENVPGDAVSALRSAGHDVSWARTDAPGSTDSAILELAVRESRVLLTFDKDFGELAWRARLPANCGVILLRLPMPPAASAARIIAEIVSGRSDWPGSFAVVEPGRVRVRPLPR